MGDILLSLYIVADLVVFVVAVFLMRRWPLGRRLIGVALLMAVLPQPICAVLVERLVERRGMKSAYVAIFRHDFSILFAAHHYLAFVLNPRTTTAVAGQLNADYLIRRTEKLKPRASVKWRILAVGGSTTFGDKLDREGDTWVHRLEVKLRRSFGPDVEVINCGVSGYTVLDNFIHYVTLLTALEPDIVLLYVGINDVWPRLAGQIRPDYSNWRKPWRGEVDAIPVPTRSLAWLPSYRLYYVVRFLRDESVFGIDQYVSKPSATMDQWRQAFAANGPEMYRLHLENFIRLLRGQRHEVIVIPQVFLSISPGAELLNIGVRQHNVVNEELARQYNLPYVDGALTATGPADLFDACHFNAAGSEKFATAVHDAIIGWKLNR